MSVKLSRKWSSKKKKPPKDNAQAEVLKKLGLEAFWTTPLDPASMLDISTWTLENQAPLEPTDLPKAFLRRLWLLSRDARSTCCKTLHDVLNNANRSPEETINGIREECVINPLDLVTAVYMSANTFLQQEMTMRMVQCQFAVPLVLPNIDPEEPSRFLLWPLRGAVSQWMSHAPNGISKVHEGDLASTYMPIVSCVKLGRCGISKSKVLNKVMNGRGSPNETFLHRGMDGGELPRRLSNGLIEIGWYLPIGDTTRDIFPVPVVMSNLRGDVSAHEKYLYLLCQASSAVVVFCGNLREKDKQLLASCKNIASKLIVIDLSNTDKDENRVVGFAEQNLEDDIGLPRGSMLQGGPFSEEDIANRLCNTLKNLLPDELKLVTLEAAAKLAEELGLNVDEGAACKRAMATVEEVLKGLDEGSAQYKEKQLPLQGPFWSKLAEIEKEERKQKKEGRKSDPQQQKEKKDITAELRSYTMTPAMKIFTDALFTPDKVERACFLSWMKLKLKLIQTEKQNLPQDLFTNMQTEETYEMAEQSEELENGIDDVLMDDDNFYTDSSFEDEQTEEQPVNTELEVSEQQSETGLEFEQILQSAENTTEPLSQEKEDIESTDDPVIELVLNMTLNEKEIQDEEMVGNTSSYEEQISDPIFDDEIHNLEPRGNGTSNFEGQQQDEPELTLAESDSTSSTQQQMCQDVSLEYQEASCSQPFEDESSSFEGQQQDEPELTLVESDSTSSTQQQMCQDVSLEHQEASCSQPFEDEPSSFEGQQQDEPELTLAESDSTSSTQQQMCQDVSLEYQEASCSQPFEDESSSFEGQQQDEPELTLAESDSTSSTQQQMCQDVSLEHQEASCSQPFEDEPSSFEGQQQDESDSTSSTQQQMCQDVSLEHQEASCLHEDDSSTLGLEHFLREMGLIFELTHISPSSGSQNVLRLPSLATDLLLYGIPLELMDGDASNIPMHWLGCVFAELKRRLPQEQCRARVLTNLGVHHARNAEVLSAVFGVKFPEGRKRSTRGVYMAALCLPDHLRKDMECDFLLLIDVEGLCSESKRNMLIQDNEMATVATGLSDVLMENVSLHAGTEFETNFTVMVNALLRIKESGSMPICQLLAQDEGIHSILQASQLKRVSDVLQTETGDKRASNTDNHCAKTPCSITCVKGPWYNMSLSEPVDAQYSKAVLKLKQNLFGALKKCAAKSAARGLTEFMSRLCAVWDTVRAESFSVGLQNTDIALAFSLLCTELSQWEDTFVEHVESWLIGATKKIFAMRAKALDAVILNGLLSELKEEAKGEVKTEVDKIRSKVEAYLKDDVVKMNSLKPVLTSNMDDLQARVTEEIIQKLETFSESHCSSTQLKNFETLLGKEQESKLCALIENSRSTKILLQDEELEEEFGGVWNKILSDFDFRPSEKDDITARVTAILKANLVSRGIQKHMKKLEEIGQNQPSTFSVYDEHFGYRSRLKHMFEDNNRLQRLEAQQLASNIIEEYHQFVAEKSSSPADFSDSYIIELLENVDKALKEKSNLEIRSAFEVDLKVYLCSAACQDFQKLHDLYAKDRDLLTEITSAKSTYLAQFIYLFRKRDQCQRVAQAFTSMVVKPTVLDYIYRPLGMCIVEEIQCKAPQYKSLRAFHQSLLEELIKKDDFKSFLEYLHSYDNLKLRMIQETVEAHLSESTNLDKWKQQRLGEIIGKFAAAVSDTAEGTNGVLSDTKPLLERVCLILEKDGDVDVSRASLEGPLFSITTEWDRFITCLMELLAEMRLKLAQEFSQNVDANQFLQCLPIKPHEALFNKLRGCNKQCPVCKAPCELQEVGHEVHRPLLHRPEGMLPHNSSTLYSISCPKSMTEGNPGQCNDTGDMSLHTLYPGWSISCEDHMPSVYWRYVLARFNERFAKEYEQEPVKIPGKWKSITEGEALKSLRGAFLPKL